jgi:hypothetical protein
MFEKIWEWSSTVVLIIGVILTAWNIYPENIWISLIGNAMWLVLGIMWKKWSLITIQIVVTIIYVLGLWINT